MKKQINLSLFLLICTILGNSFIPRAIATPTIALSLTKPTNIAAEPPALSKAFLTLQDLPSGFKDMSAQAELLQKQLNEGKGFKAENVFAFQKSDDKQFQLILGFTMQIPTRIEQASFDSSIRKEEFAQQFLIGLNDSSKGAFSTITPLPLGENIGDASTGWVTKGQMNNIPIRLEMAVFRRGNLAAMVMTLYLEGDSPSIAIADVARKFDSRIVELVSPSQNQPH